MTDPTLGIGTWGKGSRRNRKNPRKTDLILEIAEIARVTQLDINPLALKDLKAILKLMKENKTVLDSPQGRFKAPYITEIHKVAPSLSLSKLSVDGLAHLIGAINNATKYT